MQKRFIGIVTALCMVWTQSVFAREGAQASVQNAPKFSSEELLQVNGGELRGKLTTALHNQKVIADLEKLGVNPNEAKMRLAAMTNSELEQIQRGAHRQAGGDVIVISAGAVLLVVLIILLIKSADDDGDSDVTVVK